MMRRRGRKRRIAQRSKKLTAQLSFPLAILPCCVTSKRGGAQGGMDSSHEASRHEGEGEGERRTEGEDGDGWNRREAGLDQGEWEDKGGRVHERSKKRSDKNKGFHASQSKGTEKHLGDGKCFCSSFPLHPSLLPPPSSASQHLSLHPPLAMQFAETIQHGWCDFTG